MTVKRKENKIKDTRQNILDVAYKLMAEKGVKDTSLADIAKEAKISKGTLYYYYSSKADIIYDITDIHLKRITEELLAWIANIDNNVALDEIIKVVFDKILGSETRGKLHLYLISDAIISNNSLKERFREKYKEWRTMLEDGIRLVERNSKANYELLSHVLLVAIDGLTIQCMLGVEDIPLKSIATFLSSKEKD